MFKLKSIQSQYILYPLIASSGKPARPRFVLFSYPNRLLLIWNDGSPFHLD